MNNLELGRQAMFHRDNHLMYFKLPVTLKMGVAEYQPAVSQQPSPTTYTCLAHLLLFCLAFGCLGQGTSVLQRLTMAIHNGWYLSCFFL